MKCRAIMMLAAEVAQGKSVTAMCRRVIGWRYLIPGGAGLHPAALAWSGRLLLYD